MLKPLKLQFNVFSIKMLKERQNIMIQMIELFSISFPSKTKISPVSALREKCPYFEFFLSVFSRISPSSVGMGEITDQKYSESRHFLCSAGIWELWVVEKSFCDYISQKNTDQTVSWSGILTTKNWYFYWEAWHSHCAKSVRIRSFSCLNAGKYEIEKLRIRTQFTQ